MHYSIEQRTTRGGAIRWRAKVRLHGARHVSHTFARKTDARVWGQQTSTAILEGRYRKAAEGKRRTLAEAIDRYIKTVLPRKPRTEPVQKKQLEWWRRELGHLVIADVTNARIVEARDRLLASKDPRGRRRGGATSNRYLAVLSHLFTVAVNEWDWVDSNPLSRIRRLKESSGRRRFLSHSEVQELLKACGASRCSALYPIVVVAIATGMRRGEILTLKRSQIDVMHGVITLTDTKNRDSRDVALEGHARRVIDGWCASISSADALLFPSSKGNTPIELRKPWYDALKRAGLKDVCFHDLRRTAATHLNVAGATTRDIGKVLGHKTDAMVRRYTQVVDENMRKRVRAMNDALFPEEINARGSRLTSPTTTHADPKQWTGGRDILLRIEHLGSVGAAFRAMDHRSFNHG